MHGCDVGTVQGSILGPVLCAIFVSPLSDLENLTLFANDNYILAWNKHKHELLNEMKSKLDRITKRRTNSGLKVDESKMEFCLFPHKDPIQRSP